MNIVKKFEYKGEHVEIVESHDSFWYRVFKGRILYGGYDTADKAIHNAKIIIDESFCGATK